MAVTVWAAAEYGDLKDFGVAPAQVSVAVVKNGATVNIKFKFSKDGTTWPADGAAVQVGTMASAKPLELLVLSSTELEIFDGTQVLYRSKKGGRAGSWVAG